MAVTTAHLLHNTTTTSTSTVWSKTTQFSVFTWRHGSHVGVHNNSEKNLSWIWFYYYAKRERHFAIMLYTNMAVSSREWKQAHVGLTFILLLLSWQVRDLIRLTYVDECNASICGLHKKAFNKRNFSDNPLAGITFIPFTGTMIKKMAG